MSDVVERVAREIYAKMCASRKDADSSYIGPFGEFDGKTVLDGDFDFVEIARAAIAAYEAAATDHIEIGKPSPIYVIPVQGTWSQSGFKPLPDINRIRELEEALRPFAIVAEYIDTHCPDAPDSDETGIGIGDLRRARAVLEGKNDGR